MLLSTLFLFLRRASQRLNKVSLQDLLTLGLRMAPLIEERMNSGFIDGSVAAAV